MDLHALQANYMLREYRIERLLGEGGFGLTYLAFDTHLEKKVAIKEYMPSDHAVRDSDSQIIAKNDSSETVYNWGLNAFLNEAKILAKFEDSNIVRIYRFFKANGTAYIVMEYCEGGCLVDLIAKNKLMGEEALKKIIAPIVHGLQLVHKHGILHRDIKPDNIMFRQDGTPVLIDFGAARQAIGNKSRKLTTIITPGYAPLEQYISKGTIGPWSDIYSLAAVAYLCLTGKKPPDIMNRLHEDTIKQLSNRVNSTPFLEAIDLGLKLQVDDRPQNLSDWSARWNKKNHNQSKETENHHILKPIYAHKHIDQQDSINTTIPDRNNSEQNTLTILNTDDINLNKKSSGGLLKSFMIIVIFVALAFAAVFAYDYYLKQQQLNHIQNQKSKPEPEQKTDHKPAQEQTELKAFDKQQRDLTVQAQKILNQIGYLVPEDGKLDTRTISSIKSFEEQRQLVVTGAVDAILITELKAELQSLDDQAWQAAKTTNSKIAYQQYLDNHPNGSYAAQIADIIEDIEQQELLETIAQEKVKESQRQEQDTRLKQIAKEKSQLIKNIQTELKRLKFTQINDDGKLNNLTKNHIMAYQRLAGLTQNGLPTNTLLFQLKSATKWPGRLAGEVFKACVDCPAMIVIPAGSFMMGSNDGKDNEKPPHNVNIKEFILSQTEITFSQWDACFADGVCTHNPKDDQLGRTNQAAMHVNWHDTQQFIKWLKDKSGKAYRLPTEAEWEYAARAGSTTTYSWGDNIGNNNVSCVACNVDIDNNKINQVKSYPANVFGLFDMHGNVWEWTQDCWHPNYMGAPSDGQAWEPNGCYNFVVRGGSGGNRPADLRSASRGVMAADKRLNSLGFRVALDSD